MTVLVKVARPKITPHQERGPSPPEVRRRELAREGRSHERRCGSREREAPATVDDPGSDRGARRGDQRRNQIRPEQPCDEERRDDGR